MARASADYQTFSMSGTTGGGFATVPFNDGASYRAAAQVFAGLGATLGRIADKAAQRAGEQQAMADASNAIALPETTFKLKPGATDQNGTGRREPPDTPAAAKPSGKARGGRVAQAMAFYQARGYSAEHAAGVVGNLWQESAFADDVINGQRRGDNGTAFGIAQWRGKRLANLRAFAAAQGKPVTDFETQLAFVDHELQTAERGTFARLRAAKTVDEATAAFIGYERPRGWTVANPRGGHGFANRLNFAQQALAGHAGPSGAGGPVLAGGQVTGGGIPATFTPQPVVERSVFVAEPQPLALRRDGTIAGDAYDRVAMETASWRMRAGLDAELGQAYDDHKDDPQAYAKASQDVVAKYKKQAAAMGPELGLTMEQHAFTRLQTLDADVWARQEKRAYDDRNSAALAALDQGTRGLERQAYLIGTAEDGDARLAALASNANGAIDQALASGAIDAATAQKHRANTAAALAASRVQGVFDALPTAAEKQQFVAGLDDAYADPGSPLAALDPDTFRRMKEQLTVDARQMADKAQASSALEKYQMKRALDDDLESLLRTGQPGKLGDVEIDPAVVARVLGPDDAAQWMDVREQNRAIHVASATLPALPADKIEDRVSELEPKPGEPGFARKQVVFEAVERKARAVLKQREEDPAAAAEMAFPDIAAEKDAPARAQKRLDAQAALGIDVHARQPLTTAEARRYADRLDLVEDNPELLTAEMDQMGLDVQKAYGTLADEVVGQVLQQRGLGKTTAIMGAEMMRRLNIGQLPERSTMSAFDAVRKADMADAAMAGKARKPSPYAQRAVAPTAATVAKLRQNPELAAQFDQRFGAGTAQGFLQQRDEPVRRKLPNGDVELRYPDGWVETLRPDGTVHGAAGK